MHIYTRQQVKLHKNIYIWYLNTFFAFSAYVLPIWLIFNSEVLGFTYTQSILLGITPYAVSSFLEIPTGSWADRFGRLIVYRSGTLIYTVSLASYILFESFTILLIFQLLGALGYAMQSGTLQALIHDSLPTNNKKEIYDHVQSRKMIVFFGSRTITVFVGGLLFAIDPKLPFIVATVSSLVGLIVSLFFTEIRLQKPRSKNNITHIAQTIRKMWSLVNIRVFVFLLFLMQFTMESVFVFLQPAFISEGISSKEIGIVYALISVTSALGAAYSTRIIRKYGNFGSLTLMICLSTASILLLSIIGDGLGIYAALLPISFGFGLLVVTTSGYIQKYISSSHQSTALSTSSMITHSGFLVGTLLVGVMLDNAGLSGAYAYIVAINVAALPIFILAYKKFK